MIMRPDKLEHFFLANLSCLVYLQVRPGYCLSRELRGSTQVCSGCFCKYYVRIRAFKDQCCKLFGLFISDEGKLLYNIGYYCSCYKINFLCIVALAK
jgi:hypothetical protein